MMKRDVPVYLITGFLESGKTQFLDFTIHQSYFQIPDKTLLILCEEGEEEYDEESLKKMNTVIEIIEDPEDFNADTLQMLNKKYHPGRVLVEQIIFSLEAQAVFISVMWHVPLLQPTDFIPSIRECWYLKETVRKIWFLQIIFYVTMNHGRLCWNMIMD